MAVIIDGKAFAGEMRQKLKNETVKFIDYFGAVPTLAVILVGNDPASEVYVKNKGIQAVEVGFNSIEKRLPAEVSQEALLAEIDALNRDKNVHGILVQLPLPRHIDSQLILNAILPEKDVDGFHPVNVGKLWTGETGSIPCTPLGCSLILKEYLGDLAGKKALVVGRSNIVGKPMSALLLNMNATVTIAHSKSPNLAQLCADADVIIGAVGQPELIKGAWIKEGACVLDVGINRVNGKLVGDVEFAEAVKRAGYITPVPGGIGPMTIACLLQNTLTCAKALLGRQ